MSARRRGITRVDVIAMVVVLLVLAVLLTFALNAARSNARRAQCASSFKAISVGMANYAADFQDAIMGFSWRSGENRSDGWPRDPVGADSDLQAVIAQAGRTIQQRGDEEFLVPERWLPNVWYSRFVVVDYVADLFLSKAWVCPNDAALLAVMPVPLPWQPGDEKRKGGRVHVPSPPPAATPADRRWPFRSSYEIVPASYSPDQASADGSLTIQQGALDSEFLVPREKPFGDRMRTLSEVAFPDSKVAAFDTHDRHFAAKPLHFGHPSARQPLLFFDGSVSVKRTGDADPGFRPNTPSDPGATLFDYNPTGGAAQWLPPPVTAGGDKGLKGYYRWTRGGLKGRDFGGAVAVEAHDPARATVARELFIAAEP